MLDTNESALLEAYLDDELDVPERAEFEARIRETKQLAATLEHRYAERKKMHELLAPPHAPNQLRTRISADLDACDKRCRREQRAAFALPVAASAVALASLVVFVSQFGLLTPDKPVAAALRAAPSTTEVALAAGAPSAVRVPVNPPRFENAAYALRDWSPSVVDGAPAAELHYVLSSDARARKHAITVRIVDRKDIKQIGKRRLLNGHVLWVNHAYGVSTITLVGASGMGYVFAAEMSEATLLKLVSKSDVLKRLEHR